MFDDLNYLASRARRVLENAESPASNNNQSDPLTVETVNNHIYFYSGVNSDRCLALIKELRWKDSELRNEHISRSLSENHPKTPIWLHINSGGGAIFDAFSISDQIKKIETPIYSIVEGYAASAATLISMSCAKRFIQPSAYMMIHELSNVAWGKYSDFEDEMALMDMLMDMIEKFYSEYSHLKNKEIKKFLKRNSWFDASRCVKHGLVDAIIS